MKLNIYYCRHRNKSFYIKAEGMNYEHLWCPRCKRRSVITESEVKYVKQKATTK